MPLITYETLFSKVDLQNLFSRWHFDNNSDCLLDMLVKLDMKTKVTFMRRVATYKPPWTMQGTFWSCNF